MLDFSYILYLLMQALAVIVGLCVHESAHALAAWALGDKTARSRGRVSLNPLAHIDPFGTVLVPLIMIVLGGPVFAFAKPVPYNPYRLRKPRRDELLVALAGPASNLLQALLGTAVFGALLAGGLGSAAFADGPAWWVLDGLLTYVYVNLVLCFFNLIPLPPLDGSKVILYFLRGSARQRYYELQNYSMAILLAALYVLPGMLRVDPLGAYLGATAGRLYGILIGAVL